MRALVAALLPAAVVVSLLVPQLAAQSTALRVSPPTSGLWLAPDLTVAYRVHTTGFPVHVRFTGWVEDVLEIRFACGAHNCFAGLSEFAPLGDRTLSPVEISPGQWWYLGTGFILNVPTPPQFVGMYERSPDRQSVILRIPMRTLVLNGKYWLQIATDTLQASSVVELDVLKLH